MHTAIIRTQDFSCYSYEHILVVYGIELLWVTPSGHNIYVHYVILVFILEAMILVFLPLSII
uniref:Uncharacterized protein n=1 Tax=Arundo donax TaxID=35708 RepID=A0A0A9BJU7_ARUDO